MLTLEFNNFNKTPLLLTISRGKVQFRVGKPVDSVGYYGGGVPFTR